MNRKETQAPAEDYLYRGSDGVEMVYSRYPSDAGETFVLVHGIGMGRSVLDGLARELQPHGTVYAVDLPGFGESPTPEKAASIPQTGDVLAGFVASLPEAGPVLVGHSMGTQVVAEASLRHPGLARRLVLIAPTANSEEKTALWQAFRMMQDLAGESPVVLAKGAIEYLRAGIPWFLAKLRVMLDHDMEEAAVKIPVRTLVLRGERDRVCPRNWVHDIASLIPVSSYAEIPGHGHEAMIRDPRPAALLILDFLGEARD